MAFEKTIEGLVAQMEELQAEIERLREALRSIRDRGTGKRGAAVVVTEQTLRKIAEQALAAQRRAFRRLDQPPDGAHRSRSMTAEYLPVPDPRASSAEQIRQMGLAVGDTIEGREEHGIWWEDSRLTLLWLGEQVAVWRVESRAKSQPEWQDYGEGLNWDLSCRRWRRVEG